MSAILLRLLSALWSTVNAGMRLAARRGWVGSRKLPARVLSVGNLQVGGAGKTPLVALIAQEAIARGQRVCILSRGYGGIWEANGGVIAPGKEPAHPALCGDEPALLHELAPEAWIDESKTKDGCEIPFTRHFYQYVPPRPLAEIDADLDAVLGRIRARLEAVKA